MLCSVVISNYNYEKYIIKAIESILSQSMKEIEIIVVDDGSQDKSIEYIRKEKYDSIILIEKENNGQLSCFNAALPYIQGDYVFFLDADDTYEPKYIEKAIQFYEKNSFCDFLFCDRYFIDEKGDKLNLQKNKRIFPEKKYYGYTSVITYFNQLWIGAATSCISMKKNLLKEILPIPYERDWITRADDCLVWGASLKSGYKCFLKEPLVNYRIHGNNYHCGKNISKDRLYLRNIAINKLFSYLMKEFNTCQFEHLLSSEFSSLPEKTSDDIKYYLKALLKTNINNIIKIRQAISILKNYLGDK